MAPSSAPNSAGFVISGTKKGELPIKVEKRAKGKRVTVISNVSGDATKLARGLQSLLGVGGTVRHAGAGLWTVEVQGDQTLRVSKAAIDFGCLKGVNNNAIDQVKQALTHKDSTAVARTAATKYLAQTNVELTADERQRQLALESEFYEHFAASVPPSGSFDDNLFGDVWDNDVWETPVGPVSKAEEEAAKLSEPTSNPSLEELNVSLRSLGMIAECGKAVREFWETSGMTLQQFRRMALNPGARLVTDDVKKSSRPSNLVSRQKVSDWKSRGGKMSYFSAFVSAVDAHEKGLQLPTEAPVEEEQEPELKVSVDASNWHIAELSYCVPFRLPPTRLDDEEKTSVCRRALRSVGETLLAGLQRIQDKIPGVDFRLDYDAYGVDLKLKEEDFLFAPKSTVAKPDKEELKLEKKLREICALRRRQLDGEVLEKLQVDKIEKAQDLFREVAELKLRRAEKEILKVFKQNEATYRDVFHEEEWRELYGEELGANESGEGTSATPATPFGNVDTSTCHESISVSRDGLELRSTSGRWAGTLLHLGVSIGEVGAYSLEVLEGLVRLGWVVEGGEYHELGSDSKGFGYGGTGKKVTNGTFEPYGVAFKAGDVLHCEAEREEGRIRIGFAVNSEPMGVAYDVEDEARTDSAGLVAAICGKGAFAVRLQSAECVPLEEAPILENYVEFDPPRSGEVLEDLEVEDGGLRVHQGEMVHVLCDDGVGSIFVYFLDPDDPDDGGWLPRSSVRFWEEEGAGEAYSQAPKSAWEEPYQGGDWGGAPGDAEEEVNEWYIPADPMPAPTTDDWGDWSTPATGDSQVPAETSTTENASTGDLQADLQAFLKEISLTKYFEQALAWCEEMGALELDEVKENWEEFASGLNLKPLEVKRLKKLLGV